MGPQNQRQRVAVIRLHVPYLPPSSNHAYVNMVHGRTLGPKGRVFINETKSLLVQKFPRELLLFKPNKPYLIVMRFFFDDIENAGFAKGKAKNRYKVFDGGNRTKLMEDVLKDAGGIDDSQTLTSIWQKVQGAPQTLIWISVSRGRRDPIRCRPPSLVLATTRSSTISITLNCTK